MAPDSSPAIAVTILNIDPGAYAVCIVLFTCGVSSVLYFSQFSELIPPTKSWGLKSG